MGDITLNRLQSNMCNFIIGYDVLDAMCEGAVKLAVVTDAFKMCGNIMPSWEVQEAIYMKSGYMNEAARLGVPMAPTIFAVKGDRKPQSLLQEIKARGWQQFVTKQSYGFGSAGFKKLSVQECEENPGILEEYFDTHSECPEYVVQEFIEGFCRNWEVHDKDTHWDPDVKTYFLNEIEYGGTTYFPRVLKIDAIPMWAEMYASKALEIQEKMAVFSKATVESLQATADSPGDSDSNASASSASTE